MSKVLATAIVFSYVALGVVFGQSGWTEEDLRVLDKPADRMMEAYLTQIVDHQFLARRRLLESLKTPEDWKRHITKIRDFLVEATGPLPKRTPLNARITGRIDHEDYRVEKILFESQPDFLVSANLYLPKGFQGPRPAVLNVIGHYPNGKTAEHVQRRCISQAKKGFVALAIDGIGQGDRRIFDYSSDFRKRPLASNMPGGVHKTVGLQAFLSGTHTFNIMAWDTIRAIDYLVSRPEVNASEIAITGASGGGMMSSYILPFEDRIKVSVPTCNPNTYSYHVHLPSGSDHENVFFGCFAAGIDMRGDVLLPHAPKPLLINAASDDHANPPRGTWELAGWLYRAYASLGAPQTFQTSMIQGPHGYRRDQREVANAWMLEWMGGDPADFVEEDFRIEEEEDLYCAPEGNVYRIPGSREPHELITAYHEDHKPTWDTVRTPADLGKLKKKLGPLLKKVLAIGEPATSPLFDMQASRVIGEKQGVRKLTPVTLRPEQGIVLPGVLIENAAPYPNPKVEDPSKVNLIWQRKPSRFEPWIESKRSYSTGPVILYLNDLGKQAILQDTEFVDELLENGFRILAVDVRGTGETGPGLESFHWDYLIGRPLFGQRVRDVRSCVQWLRRPEWMASEIYIWANGVSSLIAAFAATECDGISGMVLEDPLLSFESVVSVRLPEYGDEILLPGVLELFDVPQVFQSLAPLKVTLINPLLGDKSPATASDVQEAYQAVFESYEAVGAVEDWLAYPGVDSEERRRILSAALYGEQ
jgi:dienelactone hydrolase/pimeloyl-ACP methyl ester carboxylesterase